MQVLLDTNIILDFALDRTPYGEKAEQLLNLAFQNKILACISASTVTDIYYVIRKEKDSSFALEFLKSLLEFIDIIPVNKEIIQAALHSRLTDFEDAVQDQSARNYAIDIIITRNIKDFENAQTKVNTPDDFIQHVFRF